MFVGEIFNESSFNALHPGKFLAAEQSAGEFVPPHRAGGKKFAAPSSIRPSKA
jgi:hypothetical protein